MSVCSQCGHDKDERTINGIRATTSLDAQAKPGDIVVVVDEESLDLKNSTGWWESGYKYTVLVVRDVDNKLCRLPANIPEGAIRVLLKTSPERNH